MVELVALPERANVDASFAHDHGHAPSTIALRVFSAALIWCFPKMLQKPKTGCGIDPMKRLLSSILVFLSCWYGAAASGGAPDPYSAVLHNKYPGFEVVGPFLDPYDENRTYRRSPESFVGEILVGDFNFDGVDDFAAGLIEEGGVAKANAGGKPDGLTVVCSGVSDNEYRCTNLVEPRPYGFHTYLDLIDWTPWLDRLEQNENEECSVQLETHTNQKFLTIVEPYGHCDTLYYQESDGTYEGCRYCAD